MLIVKIFSYECRVSCSGIRRQGQETQTFTLRKEHLAFPVETGELSTNFVQEPFALVKDRKSGLFFLSPAQVSLLSSSIMPRNSRQSLITASLPLLCLFSRSPVPLAPYYRAPRAFIRDRIARRHRQSTSSSLARPISMRYAKAKKKERKRKKKKEIGKETRRKHTVVSRPPRVNSSLRAFVTRDTRG